MISKAAASSIAASGGIRPDSHITARPVTAIKAGSAALTLVAATLSIVLGGTTVAIAGVIEGGAGYPGVERPEPQLQPSLRPQKRKTSHPQEAAKCGADL